MTTEQTSLNEEDGLDEMDDFDLLDATIDPSDVKSLQKRRELEMEIESEEFLIKSKTLYRIAMSDDNPLKID